MKRAFFVFSLSVLAACAHTPQGDSAHQAIVPWDSEEGIERIERSKAKVDFFRLSNVFTTQSDGLSCGPTTMAITLNALRLKPQADEKIPLTNLDRKLKKWLPKKYDPRLRKYTQRNVFAGSTQKVKSESEVYGKPIALKVKDKTERKSDFGIQLRQLHKMYQAQGVQSQLRVVDENLDEKQIRSEFVRNLQQKDDYVVINYKRSAIGQEGGGHISPVAAYDEESDSFLIMDVNPNRADWVWVKTATLAKGMRTMDTIENRGYLLISEKLAE